MNRYLSEGLRQLVIARAENLCEYCLIDIDDTFFGGEVDHIISVKHSGVTEIDNLAYTCQPCNRNKGSDVGSIIPQSGQFVRFFNPRTDHWSDHFELNGAIITPLSEIGEVTVKIFRFNDSDRLEERQGLIELDAYPSRAALRKLS
jgi:hypothetical protein